MIDPETAARLARRVAQLFGDVELAVFLLITKRLSRGLDLEDWPRKREAETVTLRRQVLALVAKLKRESTPAVMATLKEAWSIGVKEAGRELALAPAVPEAELPFIVRPAEAAIAELARELEGTLAATHLRILRSADDIYRSVIAEAVREGLAGDGTRRQAAQAALNRFASHGITGFTDRLGRNWSLASYTEMAVRTSAMNAALDAKMTRYAEKGHDLVRVSDAPGECERCRPYEGKVFSLTGATPGYPTLDSARDGGLFHHNCRHGFGLYVPGLSKPMSRDLADPAGDAARQQQRYLERGIRQWKLRESVAFGPNEKRYAHEKWKAWEARLLEHIDQTDGKRLRYREATPKTGRAI